MSEEALELGAPLDPIQQAAHPGSAEGPSEVTSDQVQDRSTREASDPIETEFKAPHEGSSEEANEDLLAAARYGFLDDVKEAIRAGADLHSRDASFNETALHLASRNAHKHVAEFLLEHKAHVHTEDNDGWTPLISASAYDHDEIAGLLLEKGAEVNHQTNDKWTALNYALRYGTKKTVQTILLHNPVLDSIVQNGGTALHQAVSFQDLEIVQLVLSKFPDPQVVDEDGWTALHKVPYSWHEDDREKITRALISRGAKMVATYDDQQTPLHKASRERCPNVIKQLLELEDPMVNTLDQDGCTALHYASQNGDGETVGLLLKKGAKWDSEVPGTARNALALSAFALSKAWAEKKIRSQSEKSDNKRGEYEDIQSYEKAVRLLANKSTTAEKRLVMRQCDQEEESNMLARVMKMSDLEHRESMLVWYASKDQFHHRICEELSSDDCFGKPTALELAAYHGKHVVVWWLLKTTLDSQKARKERRDALKRANEGKVKHAEKEKRNLPVGPLQPENEQKSDSISKNPESKSQMPEMKVLSTKSKERGTYQKPIRDSPGESDFTDFPLTISMLKDPPPVEGQRDSYDPKSMPFSKISKSAIKNFDATIVDFYRRNERVDFLRRSYPIWDVIYELAISEAKNSAGPESIMKRARETLKGISPEAARGKNHSPEDLQVRWIHLPANNVSES